MFLIKVIGIYLILNIICEVAKLPMSFVFFVGYFYGIIVGYKIIPAQEAFDRENNGS